MQKLDRLNVSQLTSDFTAE